MEDRWKFNFWRKYTYILSLKLLTRPCQCHDWQASHVYHHEAWPISLVSQSETFGYFSISSFAICEVGRAVLHLGSRRHGADDIESGTRMNLIVWHEAQCGSRHWWLWTELSITSNNSVFQAPGICNLLQWSHGSLPSIRFKASWMLFFWKSWGAVLWNRNPVMQWVLRSHNKAWRRAHPSRLRREYYSKEDGPPDQVCLRSLAKFQK